MHLSKILGRSNTSENYKEKFRGDQNDQKIIWQYTLHLQTPCPSRPAHTPLNCFHKKNIGEYPF